MWILKILLKTLILVVLSWLIIVIIPYYKTTVYNFTESKPFIGKIFYNPYSGIDSLWVKANFHAHSKLKHGLTNGKNSIEEMYAAYDSLEYDVACLSNYNYITPDVYDRNFYLPVYEHGINFGTVHQLVINSKKVRWFDFPLCQSIDNKQQVINEQKSDGALVVLAHPAFRNAWNTKKLSLLHNYDLFEGVSVLRNSIRLWDDALSTGHAVWVLGDDDAHSTNSDVCGICWNMVNVDTLTQEAVIASLQAGKTYATKGKSGKEINNLVCQEVVNGQFHLKLDHNSDSIVLKSDWGKQVAFAKDTNEISYLIKDSNSYVRAEVYDIIAWNKTNQMYFNPVIRTTCGQFAAHNNESKVNYLLTWLCRLGVIATHLLIVFLYYKLLRYKPILKRRPQFIWA